MTLPEMKQELAELESLPVAERTPEALARANELFKAIRRAEVSAPKPHRGDEDLGTKAMLVHVPTTLHKAFQAVCRRNGETMSTTIRALMREYVEAND